MQTLIPQFRHIPRAIFTVLAFSASTVAGVAGREHFSVILSNFLAVVSFAAVAKQLFDRSPEKMAYWVAFWIVILVEEHYIFRQNKGALGGYDMHAYDSPNRLVSSFGLGQFVFLIIVSPPGCLSGLQRRMSMNLAGLYHINSMINYTDLLVSVASPVLLYPWVKCGTLVL